MVTGIETIDRAAAQGDTRAMNVAIPNMTPMPNSGAHKPMPLAR
jgi:hypothetical protein